MNYFSKSMVSLFMIVFVIAFNAKETQGEEPFRPTHVKIQADIPGESIQAHCYAGDSGTDFGNKVLNYSQSFEFRFRTKPFGLTKYYCDFVTKHGSGNYGVFTAKLSDNYCGYACAWYVRLGGPCVGIGNGQVSCAGWKNPPAVVV